MKQLSVYTKIKVLLSVLALISLTTVLVAQNTPPKKDVNPTGDGQTTTDEPDKFQTYKGEEYAIYRKGDKVFRYNPTDESVTEITGENVIREYIYNDNLGENVFVSERKETGADGTKFIFPTNKRIAQNGNIITTTLGQWPVISVPGFPDYVLKPNKAKGVVGNDYLLKRNPIAWIDQTHLLISKGEIDLPIIGISLLDIVTGKEEKILDQYTYYDVRISPSTKYLLVRKVGPEGMRDELHDGIGPSYLMLYDFETKRFRTIEENVELLGWMTTKEISRSPEKSGFFSSALCNTNCMLGGLTYKLPFDCGQAYRVSRDGQNCTPADCNLGAGSSAYASWAGGAGPHGNPAIDFTDQQVGGTTEDHLPVRASAHGIISQAGWQDPNYTTCTPLAYAGKRVVIQHSDGTYTLYGHLSSYSVVVGQMIAQGQQVGLEGHTGHCDPCDFEHIHFQRATSPGFGATSYWTQFAELPNIPNNTTPTKGYIYLSQNGSCPGNCSITTVSSCGGLITNQNNIGIASTRASYFAQMPSVSGGNAIVQNEGAGEKVYEITMNQVGGFKAELLNVVYQTQPPATDLDVFIAKTPTGVCSDFNPLKDFMSGSNFISSSSGVTSTTNCNANYVPPTGKYHIIVDGVNNSQASYQLKVTPCPDITDNGSTKSIPLNSRQLTITANIKNVGCGNFSSPSGSFSTRFFLNTVPNLSGAYTLVTLNYTGGWSIAPNGTNSYTFTWTIPSSIPAGTYYLLETLDYYNNVCEANESNSWYFGGGPFTIPPAVAGVVDDRAADSEVFASGEVVPVETEPVLTQTAPIDASFTIVPTKCEVTVTGMKISASQVFEDSEFMLANGLGQIICSGKAKNGTIACEAPAIGIYFLTIVDRTGNKCAQKVFVNLK